MSTTSEVWPYPGSRWWRFDFHTHTPASNDVDQSITEEAWLEAAMRAELDCVVVSDHNSGGWIDRLRRKQDALGLFPPDWYRPLTLFPGVEITVADSTSRVHVLAIFDPSCDSNAISSALGACGIHSGFGDDQQTATTTGFVDTVTRITNAKGIVIPAHVDCRKGLLASARTLTPELSNSLQKVQALEVCDQNAFQDADAVFQKAVENLAWVSGSDGHNPGEIGAHSCWIKMSSPTIEGLRLALMDHVYCLLHQDENPNHLPDIFLTSLSINRLRHCGRAPEQTFCMDFHPAFNAFIGGRGTGKSTALESIRVAARRETELPPALAERMDSFLSTDPKKGVMLPDSELLLGIHRRGKNFLLRWRRDTTGNVLEESTKDGGTTPCEQGDLRERFPMSIYSQKQIDALAADPRGLLAIIDRSPNVNKAEWQRRWDESVSQFLQLMEKQRQLTASLGQEASVRAQLQDVENDLKQYEERGHGQILKEYQARSQQLRSLPLESDFGGLADAIRALADGIELPEFPEQVFGNDPHTPEAVTIHQETATALAQIQVYMRQLGDNVDAIGLERTQKLSVSGWYATVQAAIAAYQTLVQEYQARQSHVDIYIYGQWVHRRGELQQQIATFEGIRNALDQTESEMNSTYQNLLNLRGELLQRRQSFTDEVVGANQYVKMELKPFADMGMLEEKYRQILDLGTSFTSSVWDVESKVGLLADCFANGGSDNTDDLVHSLKQSTHDVATGQKTDVNGHFANRLKGLLETNPSALDRLWCWWPEDQLVVKYSRYGGGAFDDLEKGSAGQRAAAILAFLLSYGDEPLVIDQPEDDLDNALIYELIVKQIQENKTRRQLLIVTHNPNIVVNGDAELIHVLKFSGGQVRLDCVGGLEEGSVRDAICEIMEGGREAFAKRYKRIMEHE